MQDRQAKQTFLREHLFGHSSGFTQYCDSLREDGSNVDNWTLEELDSLVTQYKSICKESRQQPIRLTKSRVDLSTPCERMEESQLAMCLSQLTVTVDMYLCFLNLG